MPVEVAEHIFLMPASCLSLTNTRQDQHANKLLITARNLLTPAFAEVNKRVFFYSRRPLPSLPNPPPFFIPPYPLPLSAPSQARVFPIFRTDKPSFFRRFNEESESRYEPVQI